MDLIRLILMCSFIFKINGKGQNYEDLKHLDIEKSPSASKNRNSVNYKVLLTGKIPDIEFKIANTMIGKIKKRILSNIESGVLFKIMYQSGSLFKYKRMQINKHGIPIDTKYNSSEFSSVIDKTLPVYILIHGWNEMLSRRKFYDIMKYITFNEIGNALAIQWRGLMHVAYPLPALATEFIGLHASEFIKLLTHKFCINPRNITIIGHNLGAHIAGYIGRTIPGIQRIEGLEPSKLIFKGLVKLPSPLSHSDANFVSITHTDDIIYGLNNLLGHVDFIVNGATIPQPTCRGKELSCSHLIVLNYYYRSFTEKFRSSKCSSFMNLTGEGCPLANVYLGVKTTTELRGVYFVDII